MNKRLFFYCAEIFLPLLIGVCIYLVFKEDSVIQKYELLFPWFQKLRSMVFIEFYPKTLIGHMFKNYFCDFLWASSLSASAYLSTQAKSKALVISVGMGLVVELLQKQGIVLGTFDVLDIVVELFAAFLTVTFSSIFDDAYFRKELDNKSYT